jgi:TPR repeat protein
MYQAACQLEFDLQLEAAAKKLEESEALGLNHAPTQFRLGIMHLDGDPYDPPSTDKALRYLQLAANQGHGEATAHIAIFHLTGGAGFPQNPSKSAAILRKRVKAGCIASTYWLAALTPSPMPRNEVIPDFTFALNPFHFKFADHCQHAFQLLHKAAEGGFYKAQELLALHYARGNTFVKQNLDQSVHWATQHSLSNPTEQCNKDKAHGTNAEIDDAMDYIYGTNGRSVDFEQALALLVSAADKGYAKAFHICGLISLHNANYEAAELAFIRAAVRGCPHGQYRLATLYLDRDSAALAHWAQLAVDQGHIDAIHLLGGMYLQGIHFEKDVKKCLELFNTAAQGGHPPAQIRLAQLYYDGTDVSRSYSTVAEWCLKALATPFDTSDVVNLLSHSKRRDHQIAFGSSHHYLGLLHLFGDHFPQDPPKAVEHFTIAAEAGDCGSQVLLGDLFSVRETASLLPPDMRDDAAAFKWHTMAANQNHPRSQYQVANRLNHGIGVEPDIDGAVDWYRKAGLQGDLDALYELGMLHYEASLPHLVPKDTAKAIATAKAIDLLTYAAERGHPEAKIQLGVIENSK